MHLKAILAEEGVQNIREKFAFEVKTLKRMAFEKKEQKKRPEVVDNYYRVLTLTMLKFDNVDNVNNDDIVFDVYDNFKQLQSNLKLTD